MAKQKNKCDHKFVGNESDRMCCYWCGFIVPLNKFRAEWNDLAAYDELITMLKRDGIINV